MTYSPIIMADIHDDDDAIPVDGYCVPKISKNE